MFLQPKLYDVMLLKTWCREKLVYGNAIFSHRWIEIPKTLWQWESRKLVPQDTSFFTPIPWVFPWNSSVKLKLGYYCTVPNILTTKLLIFNRKKTPRLVLFLRNANASDKSFLIVFEQADVWIHVYLFFDFATILYGFLRRRIQNWQPYF